MGVTRLPRRHVADIRAANGYQYEAVEIVDYAEGRAITATVIRYQVVSSGGKTVRSYAGPPHDRTLPLSGRHAASVRWVAGADEVAPELVDRRQATPADVIAAWRDAA